MRTTLLSLVAIFLASIAAAQDDIYLEITQPGLRKVTVAAPPLMVMPGTPVDVAKGFQETLDVDLRAAAPIAIVERRLYALVEDDPRPEVLNERWRSIGAQFLLSGTVVRAGGQIVVETRLIDLVSGEFAFAKRYRAGISASEVVAHTLANDLVQVFTGRQGPFLSRIAYISDRTGESEIWVMDWNGKNKKQLTKHNSLALAPSWSPDGKHLVFTSYLRGTPAIYQLTPQEGYLKLLWDKGGVNSSASVSPNGKTVAFASSLDGNVDIYTIPIEGGEAQRLTTARGIDTQPSWAPNGRQIAFTSTRSGAPQIYMMDADGSNVRRVSFNGFFHDESTWAYDGTRIACTTRDDGNFQIATIDAVTNDRKVIQAPGNNESPCFSPEGSMIAFESDRSGKPQIYITDANGVPRQLTTEGSNHSPTWIGAAR
jgi:TolB protein